MYNRHINFKLRASVGVILATLLLGQTAVAAQTTKHATGKSQKATHKGTTATTSKPVSAAPAVKPAVTTAAPAVPAPAAPVALDTDNAEVKELITSHSFIEAGVLGVSDTNWKFGQYNGLPNSGAYGLGNFDINGGGAYGSDDATRWRLTGKNIGLETREFTGEYKDQGKYKLNIGYDEIARYGQGTYQTPYIGAGGNILGLPVGWQYPTSTAFQTGNMRNLTPRDQLLFQNAELSTKRRRFDGGFSYFLDNEWELKSSMRHEEKNGTQTLGASIGPGLRGVILPQPISQSTDQINASMNFTGEKAYGSFAYYGSIFHNDYDSITFANAFQAGSRTNSPIGRMSTMPDNQFHQFTLSGGYNFSPDTKLVGSGGYGRNWQDQSFLPYSTFSTATPVNGNLNGAVDFKSANVKLTHRATKDLNFAAAYKYDERENLTSVNTYFYPGTDNPASALSARSNTPFSRRVQTGNLDLSYAIAKGHTVKAGYEVQNIDRWCNGTWTSCADTPSTLENIGKLDYIGNLTSQINAKLGYAYSNRTAYNYNQDSAYLASYGPPQTFQQASLYNQYLATGWTAWGPNLGYAPRAGIPYPFPALYPNNNVANNIVADSSGGLDISGLGRFNTAPRERQGFHSLLNYQATEKLALGVNGDYRYDIYYESSYGLLSSKNWAINFDSSYAFSEDLSGHVFYTYQDMENKMAGSSYGSNTNTGTNKAGSVIGGCYNSVLGKNNNAKIDPCLNYWSNMGSLINTVGLGVKQKGLLSGALDLNGDFLLSFARTNVDVTGGQYVQNPAGTAANGPFYYIPATNMPFVNTQTYQFKFDAKYSFNKASAAHLTYMFQHMWSNDYSYIGMQQYGSPTGVMPTNMQAPVYSIHAVGLSYIYNF